VVEPLPDFGLVWDLSTDLGKKVSRKGKASELRLSSSVARVNC